MQITAEVAGADIQMEHATITAVSIQHIEIQRIPRTDNTGLKVEVDGGDVWFTDLPEGLGEVLAEAYGKWNDDRSVQVTPADAPKLDVKAYAATLKSGGMRCNCDLDNWQPEATTGHSHVCRIHRAALEWKRKNA